MDTTRPEVIKTLSEAENHLRRTIAEAAARGDYSGVDMARQVAVEVQEIRERLANVAPVIARVTGAKQIPAKKQGEDKARKGRGGGYPRFLVENDTLTKIGWSKKEKKEYTHRVSKAVFEQTLRAMAALSNGKAGPFTAEQIMERLNKAGGDFTPSYQVYLVIAFLRKARCIRQEGRDGYSIFPELTNRASRAWDEACRA